MNSHTSKVSDRTLGSGRKHHDFPCLHEKQDLKFLKKCCCLVYWAQQSLLIKL